MALELRVSFPSETPIVGCELVPEIKLCCTSSFQVPPHRFVFKWYRLEREKCSVHNSKLAAFQCTCCASLNLPAHESYHCSVQCFHNSWSRHQELHNQMPAGHHASNKFESYKTSSLAVLDRGYKEWVYVDCSKTYTPEKEDVGCLLKLECIALDSNTGVKLVDGKVIESCSVIIAPKPQPRNMIRSIQIEQLRTSDGTRPSVGGAFRVLSYNVLANIYAMQSARTYCKSWALIWQYRRQRLLNEILGYEADIICLQEVQSNHFENFFKPELSKCGYSVVYKGKTMMHFVGEEVTDGCATFFRHDRFNEIDHYELEFKSLAIEMVEKLPESLKKTAIRRLAKDNVALIVVLEWKENATANVHIHANANLSDTKIFQVKALLEELEKTNANAHMPLLICADLNSCPGSVPYNLVLMGKVDSHHQELEVDPTGIISKLELSHKLPTLASVYPSFFQRNFGSQTIESQRKLLTPPYNEPHFTNYSRNFKGTIDYIFYTVDSLTCESVLELLDETAIGKETALPTPIWPSDHIAVMAAFRHKLGE